MIMSGIVIYKSHTADSGTGESLQKLPKSTESLVSASSSGLSEAYILQSPETGMPHGSKYLGVMNYKWEL